MIQSMKVEKRATDKVSNFPTILDDPKKSLRTIEAIDRGFVGEDDTPSLHVECLLAVS